MKKEDLLVEKAAEKVTERLANNCCCPKENSCPND